MNTVDALRQQFLAYFQQRGHTVVHSAPLVPTNDPTLLFTNAGMVQFKEDFLGQNKRSYQRAVSSQCCIRAGGKHNDLEQVGYTARHHTFFEMLGNFSFGDYFKTEAITHAWTFLTQHLMLPQERLWVTVHQEDQETANLWLQHIGLDPKRLSYCGDADNFWSMGDTGPCGPCTEIFYDHGPQVPGVPPGHSGPEGDRYVELWNLVFMQYHRNDQGRLLPLPCPAVDTGMGLERLAAVMQGVHSNYAIDVFQALMGTAAQILGCACADQPALKVIADHTRAMVFLMHEGVMPSNEGRGYVLRRIIRRAARHGSQLQMHGPFLHQLVAPVVALMRNAYPELEKTQDVVRQALMAEEDLFAKTLKQGVHVYHEVVGQLKDQQIPGALAFKLYDTYGFPLDLTMDMAREQGLTVDTVGFAQAMAAQKARSQKHHHFKSTVSVPMDINTPTEFTGYDTVRDTGRILAIMQHDRRLDALKHNESGVVVLDRTPFYAQSGGQIGDQGLITQGDSQFVVHDTQKLGSIYIHYGTVISGVLRVNQSVTTAVDAARNTIAAHHTATHLLHSALRRVLGTHVVQKGSLVSCDRLRFDFAHGQPLSAEETQNIERLINQKIRENILVETQHETRESVKKNPSILALFDEQYGDRVRVLQIGDFSSELCGGTHVTRTGDLGLFKITGQMAVSAGVRRIEAVVCQYAWAVIVQQEHWLQDLCHRLKAHPSDVVGKLDQWMAEHNACLKQLQATQSLLVPYHVHGLLTQAVLVGSVHVVAAQVEQADPRYLRMVIDQLKVALGTAVVVLAAVDQDRIVLQAGVTEDCPAPVHAGRLLGAVAAHVQGKAGGKRLMAQGAGTDISQLQHALDKVLPLVRTVVLHP